MRILFVDDDEVVARSVEMALRQRGHDCEITDLGERALSLAKRHDYDIIVLDVGLPDVDGDQVARRMKVEGIETPLLLQSGLDDPTLAAEAKSLGADDFLAKPFNIADLIERMEIVLGLPRSGAARREQRPASPDRQRAENKTPDEKPAAPSQNDPPQRPSAVAEARAALRAQPPAPTRLQAASEVVAGGGAKALSKAREALATQRGGRAKTPCPPGAAGGPEGAAERGSAGGARVFAEPMARVRAIFGDKPLSTAAGKAGAALRAKLSSRRIATDEAETEPAGGELEAETKGEAGSDGRAGLGLAARARAALDANPLSQAVAKPRTAPKDQRGARAAAESEAEPAPEPAPEMDLPPELTPEFWAEPGSATLPETVPEAEFEADGRPCGPASAAGHATPAEREAEAEARLRDSPEAEAAPARDAAPGVPAEAPAPDPAPGPEADSKAATGQETAEFDGEAAPKFVAPVPSQPAAEPEAAFGGEAPAGRAPDPEPEPQAQPDAEPTSGEAAESPESQSDAGAPGSDPAPDPAPQPRPEAAATEECDPRNAEAEGREIAPEMVPEFAPAEPEPPPYLSETEIEPQPQAGPAAVEQPGPQAAEPDGPGAAPAPLPGDPGEPASGPPPEAAPASDAGQLAALGAAMEAAEQAADEEAATRRRHARRGTVEAGVIDDGKSTIPCVILDLSESGAGLMLLDEAQPCPWRFLLVPVDGPERHCVRRWRDGDKVGVEFEEPDAGDDQDTLRQDHGEESDDGFPHAGLAEE